jgi:hypothetical protein
MACTAVPDERSILSDFSGSNLYAIVKVTILMGFTG